MSRILQLQISGVRAFDNHDTQHLTFASPLTLICGQNGVGKTTIIESLRYVTTGDLPPNVKGGAFVHDPRMSSESEVFAQVRLLFQSVTGARMVATRSMRLSVSAGQKMTFKTLEGAVKEQVDSDKLAPLSSVSARSADLNQQVPLLLGVPAAILNYVVFCHQEDSLWPFSEPSAVKKKFDDIFEATKYTKALDSLKVIRKDYMTNIRVETKDVEHLEEDKQRVTEREAQLNDLRARLADINADTASLQNKRVEKSNELNATVEHNQHVQRLDYVAADIQKQIVRAEQDAELLRGDLTSLIPGAERSTTDIESELNSSDQRQQELGEELSSKSNELHSIQKKIAPLNTELASIDNQQGRLEQALEMQQQRRNKRKELVGNPEEDEMEWKKNQDYLVENLTAELDALEVSNRKAELELTQKVSSAEAQHLQLIQSISSAKKAILDSEAEAKNARSQLSELEKRESIANFQEKLVGMQNRVAELQTESSTADEELQKFETSGKLKVALQNLKDKEDAADASRKQLTDVIDASKRMSQLHHYQGRRKELENVLDSTFEKLQNLLPSSNSQPHSSDSNEALKSTAEDHLRQLKQDFEQAQSQLEKTETHLQIEKRNLASAKKRQTAITGQINELKQRHELSAAFVENFDSDLNKAEEAVLEATEEQEQLSFAHKYFERALKRAEEPGHPSCLLCEHVKSPEEATTLIKLLQSKIASLNITPEEAQKETERHKRKVDDLKRLVPHIQRYKQLVVEEESVVSEITNLDASVVAGLEKEKVSGLTRKEESKVAYEKLSESVDPIMSSINRYEGELSEISSKIEIEEKIMGTGANGSASMTLNEAQSHQESCERELRLGRQDAEDARNEKERLKARSAGFAQNIKDLKLAISELELTSARAQQLDEKLQRLKQEQDKHRSAQTSAEREIPAIVSLIETEKKELSRQKFENAKEEKVLAEKRTVLFQNLRKFDDLSKEIADFDTQHGSNPLKKLAEKRQTVKNHIDRLHADTELCQGSIKETEKVIADFTSFRRNLQDNIRLRHCDKLAEDLREKHASAQQALQEERSRFGSSPDELEARIRDLQEEVGGINHLISKMSGESQALQEQIQVIRHELATTYRDTALKYEKAVAQLNSSRSAAHELAHYSVALDRSIMKYHHMKMDEINESLDQMWKQTYTGTDIDSIMICSEPGEGGGSTSASAASSRTSHNYRVCMVKQDTVLDMRGRCSAGQKVLASILIRMALAECFGNSSGLIVLDEPTTNLDHENIEALAHSLSDIIAMRRVQSNFQLIVITHDEHFLTQMNPSSHCNSFYKISRDDRQLSTITKLPISNLS